MLLNYRSQVANKGVIGDFAESAAPDGQAVSKGH